MNKEILIKELQFKAVRSSGAGGQHVNKVSSKVMLSFDLLNSAGLSVTEKERLYKRLSSRLTAEKVLILECEETRSQLQNKERIIIRLFELLKKGLFVPKKRIASKPSKASVKRGKDKKKRRSDLKSSRRKPDY